MPRRSTKSASVAGTSTADNEEPLNGGPQRSAYLLLALFILLVNGSWAVYHYQYKSLPLPLHADQAGKRGFSEVSAMAHVKHLAELGPHPLGSNALERALQYVLAAAENIKQTAHWEVDVDVDLFHAETGANRLVSGLFKGKTLVYSDLRHVVLRILPKYLPEAADRVILVSSHIDTVFSAEGAGDCSSCVGVMLELARGISQWAHGFKNGIIFLFNTGEEEGLSGAHSFITQHQWRNTIRFMVDLEAMGIGGKSGIFQSGSDSWAIETFARVAKYPSGQIGAQDLFNSGVIKSATDFQVYKEVAGLPGLDFAYVDLSAVYHTKNDKLKLLKLGSLQHLGENMMAFLLEASKSSHLEKELQAEAGGTDQSQTIFFDVLGMYMVVYSQRLASMLYNSVILQSLLLWSASLLVGGYSGAITFGLSCLGIILMWIFSLSLSAKGKYKYWTNTFYKYNTNIGMYMVVYSQRLASMLYNSVILQSLLLWSASLLVGGYSGAITFGLSCLGIILMWIFSLSLSALVAFIVPLICSSPVPYIANPWIVVGLFGAPAVLGALAGQHIGFLFLQKYLRYTYSTKVPDLSQNIRENIIKWEAERWLFKGGFIQWLILLIVGNFYKVGSSYLAVVWLVSPVFAYGLMEATLSPVRLPKKLKSATLIVGLSTPLLVSAGTFIRFVGTITGTLVRFDRNPGGTPEWLGNLITALLISAVVCLTLVYILSYIHLSGAKGPIIISVSVLVLSLAAVSTGILPTFTEDISRTVNVVHVVETTGKHDENQDPLSYISLFSATPGKLIKEVEGLKDEQFACGTDKSVDFVSFTVKYGCLSSKDSGYGWSKSEIPTLHVESDSVADARESRVLIDTKQATRWTIAINTREISDFTFEANAIEVVPLGGKSNVDGWHTIQFAGGKKSPTKFHLNLIWSTNATHSPIHESREAEGSNVLLRLRTDVNRVTPIVARVLKKLPPWCSQFGKSTSPFTLAFLTGLPVNF